MSGKGDFYFLEMPCYDENAESNYLGSVSMTLTGKLCDIWSKYKKYNSIQHDYCRNFGENKPWCFVNGKKEYCSIKSCPPGGWIDPTCFKSRGEHYYGTVSNSRSGRKCLPWYNVSYYRFSNIDHSYCRNYDSDLDAPWCYVNKQKKRELCDIPKCVLSGT